MLLVASRNAAFACAAVTETPGALPSTVRTPELLSAAVIMATETLTPDRDSCFRKHESTLTFFLRQRRPLEPATGLSMGQENTSFSIVVYTSFKVPICRLPVSYISRA